MGNKYGTTSLPYTGCMDVKSYRDLIAWQKSIELVKHIYELAAKWPKEELYGLASQIKRAAVSVPSNIAEGHGRRSTKDYIRHLNIAYGSLMEVETQLYISFRLGFTSETDLSKLTEQTTELGRIANGLITSLNRKRNSPDP